MSVLMLVSASTFAQSTQGNGKLSRNSENGWNSFYVQYNNIGTDYSIEEAEYQKIWDDLGAKDKLSGICIGYSKSTPLSPSLPLFFEYGGGLQYSWYSYKGDYTIPYSQTNCDYDVKLSLLSIKVPVSIAYVHSFPDSKWSIEPNAGVYVRANVYGNVDAKLEYSEYYAGDRYNDKDQYELNILKDKDCNGHAASIIQVGCHIGVNISYAKYFIGVSYNKDFSKIYDGYTGVKLNTTSITAGIRF